MSEMKIQSISVDDIDVNDGFNARASLGDIEGLTRSIKHHGVQQPLGVRKVKDGFQLVYGFRRIQAAQDAEVLEVPCIVYPQKTKQKLLMLLNLQENVVRQGLNPMDEARGAARLEKKGYLPDEIQEALGWSKTLFTQRAGLLEMSDTLQEALQQDRISVSQARAIDQLPEDRHERFADVAHGLSSGRLKELVDKELEKIHRSANPELDDGGGGDDTETPNDGDDKDDFDPVALSNSITSALSDIAAFAYAKSESDENDGEGVAQSILTIRSIDWSVLNSDDLQAFEELVGDLVETFGCDDAASEIEVGDDDGDDDDEGDDGDDDDDGEDDDA